jgi:hypothetical protein
MINIILAGGMCYLLFLLGCAVVKATRDSK